MQPTHTLHTGIYAHATISVTVWGFVRTTAVTWDYKSILRHSMLPSLWCTFETENFSHVVQLNTAVTNYMLELAAVAPSGICLILYLVTAQQHQLSVAYYTFLVFSLYRCDGNTLYLSRNSIHIGAKLCTDQVLSSQEMSSQRGVD